MQKAYLVDVGVLLTSQDEEFEQYSHVYDKQYGYYDEGQWYCKCKPVAKQDVRVYVRDGLEGTYGIVSATVLPDDFDFEDGYVENESYLVDDIIYSVAKINGEIVENFINTTKAR